MRHENIALFNDILTYKIYVSSRECVNYWNTINEILRFSLLLQGNGSGYVEHEAYGSA